AAALPGIRSGPPSTRSKGGRLPYRGVWIRSAVWDQLIGEDGCLALESIRAREAKFWAITADLAGQTTERLTWKPTRNGIAVILPTSVGSQLEILGQIQPVSINRIQLSLNSESEIRDQSFRFERTGGLLIGALLMVAFFSFVVAIFNRDRIFFLYAGWLLTTLRIAAYNGDWDPHWLSIPLGGEALQLFLRLTYVAHVLISLSLFQAL